MAGAGKCRITYISCAAMLLSSSFFYLRMSINTYGSKPASQRVLDVHRFATSSHDDREGGWRGVSYGKSLAPEVPCSETNRWS